MNNVSVPSRGLRYLNEARMHGYMDKCMFPSPRGD